MFVYVIYFTYLCAGIIKAKFMYNKTNVVRKVETRTCINCGKQWDVVNKNPHPLTRIQCFCVECVSNLSIWDRKVIMMNNDNTIRSKYLESKRNEFLKNYKRQIITRTKKRALLKGLEFSLVEEDIIIPECCPLLEIPLIVGTKGEYENSPSIDRIDNTKGYTKDNIQIISKKANSMKNSATIEELKTFYKNILRYSPNNI